MGGLEAIRWSSALSLVGLVLVGVLFFFTGQLTPAFSPSFGPNMMVSFDTGLLHSLLLVGAIGILLQMVVFYLYHRGFAELRRVQTDFSSPSTFALVALGSLVLVLLGLVSIIQVLDQLASCTPSGSPIPQSCFSAAGGGALAAFALLGVGALLLLIGTVGVLIGIWRLGERYQRSGFKVAAILFIFPFVNIVGSILILVETTSLLGQGRSGQSSGSPPPSGPPPLS